MDMKQVYTQIVMQHARSSDYKHALEEETWEERGHNPSCGDDITLHVKMSEDGETIEQVSFEGHGCAISQASTSLMCELMEGKRVDEAKETIVQFLGMIKGEITDEDQLEEVLGDAVALKDVSHMPQRVKCAELAWRTLGEMMEEKAQ